MKALKTARNMKKEYQRADALEAIEGVGFATTRAKALRAVKWFNGGHPRTERCPVTAMRNGRVCDTECIPLRPSPKAFWTEMELSLTSVKASNVNGKRTAVGLYISTSIDGAGHSTRRIPHVSSVELHGDTLVITGYCFNEYTKRSNWREVVVTLEVVDEPEAEGKPVPKWYMDSMITPISVDDWLEPIRAASTTHQPKADRSRVKPSVKGSNSKDVDLRTRKSTATKKGSRDKKRYDPLIVLRMFKGGRR